MKYFMGKEVEEEVRKQGKRGVDGDKWYLYSCLQDCKYWCCLIQDSSFSMVPFE